MFDVLRTAFFVQSYDATLVNCSNVYWKPVFELNLAFSKGDALPLFFNTKLLYQKPLFFMFHLFLSEEPNSLTSRNLYLK